ncbi:MAG: ferrous iron transport protein A [Candidatus Caenarcaniphilales bacterium]|nr:ferrous iron transport protein A [Candidatus Caenarcaniphilales bacterium]
MRTLLKTDMNLNEVRPGQNFIIKFIPEDIELRLCSLGLRVGDIVSCISRNFRGPVVLRKKNSFSQLAINHNFAQSIAVNVK